MKKLILFVLFVSINLFSNAQQANSKPKVDATTRATKLTQSIDKVVTLTPEEKTQVMALCLDRTKAMDVNHSKNDKNQAAFDVEKTRIIDKWQADLKKTLTADQFTKLKAYQAEQKKKGESDIK